MPAHSVLDSLSKRTDDVQENVSDPLGNPLSGPHANDVALEQQALFVVDQDMHGAGEVLNDTHICQTTILK